MHIVEKVELFDIGTQLACNPRDTCMQSYGIAVIWHLCQCEACERPRKRSNSRPGVSR